MALFHFSDKYAMFDTTPVENLFIQEYMLRADGEFVKVYLYGLMQCYHPMESASIKTIARDLGMEENRVENAFAYWERMGLVRRVSDNPRTWAFENLKQKELMRAQDDDGLYHYRDFNNSLQAQFGTERLLHPQDFACVYDWIEGLGLPEEVVLMLVSGQIRSRGKKFSFKSLDKEARRWAEAGVQTIADAELMSNESSERTNQIRMLYKKLGKRHAISEPDEALFVKWTEEWGFSIATIMAASDQTTKGVPTFGYLDGILERMKREGLRDAKMLKKSLEKDAEVKALLQQLGMRGTAPTDDSKSMLDGFLQSGFEAETIALACTRVARRGGKLDALCKTLDIWKENGALTLEAAKVYLASVDVQRGGNGKQGLDAPPPAIKPGKLVPAQQYTQREYTREELYALFEVI